ncbi:hypothetical protein Tco_1463939, partial [Tanacetum coccineum]
NIHVDNKSAICVVKNPVYHSKTKHIEIRYHFIRDSYQKRLIKMVKIHTDNNVADLLSKAFDVKQSSMVGFSVIINNWMSTGWGDSVERTITTVDSFDVAQDSDNIIRTQTTAMPNVDILQRMDIEGHTFGSGKGRMEHQFELTANVPLTPHDSPLLGDDDLDEEDASKQGRGNDKIKPILCNFTLCLWMLEAEEESTMAFELIKFIKSMFKDSDFDVLDTSS